MWQRKMYFQQPPPPPSWLPNWQYADEYAHLTTTTEHRCESMEISYSVCKTREIITRRLIKPGSLEAKKSNTPKHAFAWEFLRRNPDYQADYQRLVDMAEEHGATEYYSSDTSLSILRSNGMPDSPNETPYPVFHAELYRTLTKWGIAAWLQNPAHDIHDSAELADLWRMGYNISQAVHVFYDNGDPIPLHGGIIPTDTEKFVLFDISRPIAPQIRKMQKHLEAQQRLIKNGKLIQASKTVDSLFTKYLRILDADAVRANDDTIVEILYPESNTTHYSKRSQTNPARNFLKNHRKAAYALRNEDYRLLLV